MNNQSYPRKQRFQWYLQVDKEKRPIKEVCQIFGVSRKTYYKWRKCDLGLKGDTSYQSTKNQPNTKLTHLVRIFIEEQKLKTNYGPLKMKLLVKKELGLDISTTIIYRYYKKKKLIRKPQKRQPWYEPLKYHLTIKKPGQGVQMDIKYVYERGVRMYQFSVFDPFTEKYHFTVFPSKESKNAIMAFKRAEKYFSAIVLEALSAKSLLKHKNTLQGCFHND